MISSDLEVWVWGRLKSLKMAWFEFLMLNNIMILKSGLEVTQDH